MKYSIEQDPKWKYTKLEWSIWGKITGALRSGKIKVIEQIMAKYSRRDVQRFIKENIDVFFSIALSSHHSESINFIIRHVEKDLLMEAIESDDYLDLRNFIDYVSRKKEESLLEQSLLEIWRETLAKLAELDVELGKLIYSVGHAIFNN